VDRGESERRGGYLAEKKIDGDFLRENFNF